MKRYRVLSFDFDSRAIMLGLEIRDEWEESVKAGHVRAKEQIRAGLSKQFGSANENTKIQNFIDLGPKPWSVIAFHNRFADQVRTAFVMGSYYTALTGACALGERILNHLLIHLRDEFRGSAEYKRVYRKNSFDDWRVPIDILDSWGVLLPETTQCFRSLAQLRNRALHFDPITDTSDRELSLNAIRLLDQAIDSQFGCFGLHPWFIPDTPGASYIRQTMETQPFIRKIYLPNCRLVGPFHRLEFVDNRIVVRDEEYPQRSITDEEFRDLLSTTSGARIANADALESHR